MLGYAGDTVGQTQQGHLNIMMDAVETFLLHGIIDFVNGLYSGTAGHTQGTMYTRAGMRNITFALSQLSTSLDVNYFEECKMAKYWPYFWLYQANPRYANGEPVFMLDGDEGPKNAHMEIGDVPGSRFEFYPITHFLGLSQNKESQDLAGVA